MKIAVLGAGAWGTAVALAAAAHPAGHEVLLWARNAEQVQAMHRGRCNERYLPGFAFAPNLQVSSEPVAALAAMADLVIVATPMAALRDMFVTLAQVPACPPVVWLCKGFEQGPLGLLPHEVAAEVAPDLACGVLSGPSFAQEVAQGLPVCLVAASQREDVATRVQQALHSNTVRVYASTDVAGVEVGGAVKNVMAIAAGLCDGLRLGLNARAALLTRGLAEMSRLGMAFGARPETFMGLSGMGDLLLTATGDLSRNRKVGLLLARGLSLDEAVASLGHVAEGVYSARTVAQRARALGVEMPVVDSVVALMQGQLTVQQALHGLMGRAPKFE